MRRRFAELEMGSIQVTKPLHVPTTPKNLREAGTPPAGHPEQSMCMKKPLPDGRGSFGS